VQDVDTPLCLHQQAVHAGTDSILADRLAIMVFHNN